MKSASIKCYSAEEYDKSKKVSVYFDTFGNVDDLERQKNQIRKMMTKRNNLFRNGIPTDTIDKEIEEFKNEVGDMKTKRLTVDDVLPLQRTRKCPPLHLSEGADSHAIFGSSKRGKSSLMKISWITLYLVKYVRQRQQRDIMVDTMLRPLNRKVYKYGGRN